MQPSDLDYIPTTPRRTCRRARWAGAYIIKDFPGARTDPDGIICLCIFHAWFICLKTFIVISDITNYMMWWCPGSVRAPGEEASSFPGARTDPGGPKFCVYGVHVEWFNLRLCYVRKLLNWDEYKQTKRGKYKCKRDHLGPYGPRWHHLSLYFSRLVYLSQNVYSNFWRN